MSNELILKGRQNFMETELVSKPPTPEEAALLGRAARAAYEVVSVYSDSINDAPPPWTEASPEMKAGYVLGVRAVMAGLSLRRQHEDWMLGLMSQGWKPGAQKDSIAKTHPRLVPYDQLPVIQRTKDRLFQRTVQAVLGLPYSDT
jgi:hypothetical protein